MERRYETQRLWMFLSFSMRKRQYKIHYFNQSNIQFSIISAKSAKVWIVSDIRRKTDLKWFKENYGAKIKTVKIFADDIVRAKRGWVFANGVDDAESECDLDDVDDWDFIIDNNDASVDIEDKLSTVLDFIQNFT